MIDEFAILNHLTKHSYGNLSAAHLKSIPPLFQDLGQIKSRKLPSIIWVAMLILMFPLSGME